jgi:hypothetical protein
MLNSSQEVLALISSYPAPWGDLFLIGKLLTEGFSFNYPVIQLPWEAFPLLFSFSQEVLALIIQLSSSSLVLYVQSFA